MIRSEKRAKLIQGEKLVKHSLLILIMFFTVLIPYLLFFVLNIYEHHSKYVFYREQKHTSALESVVKRADRPCLPATSASLSSAS